MSIENERWEVAGSPYAIRSCVEPYPIVLHLEQQPMPTEALAHRIVDDHNASLKQLFTLAEAAACLTISERTLVRWVRAGRVKQLQLGPATVRVHRDEIDKVMGAEKPDETLTTIVDNEG